MIIAANDLRNIRNVTDGSLELGNGIQKCLFRLLQQAIILLTIFSAPQDISYNALKLHFLKANNFASSIHTEFDVIRSCSVYQ